MSLAKWLKLFLKILVDWNKYLLLGAYFVYVYRVFLTISG